MGLLTRTVVGLQQTLALQDQAATKHALAGIAENTDLLQEVNVLRKEVDYMPCSYSALLL